MPKRGSGWVPNYHGAWSMVAIPPILGIIEGGFVKEHVLVLGTWWVGYFCFFAMTLWLRSHLRARYLRPMLTYGAIAAAFGIAALVSMPALARWALPFIPLACLSAWAAWIRKDRSLWSGFSTIIAACLLLPVSWDVSQGGSAGFGATPEIWLQTVALFGYFGGTVLYVKTNIRERNSQSYFIGSVVWHAAWFAAAVFIAMGDQWHLSIFHAVVWALLVVRAVVVPKVLRPRTLAIGVGEIVASALVALTLLI